MEHPESTCDVCGLIPSFPTLREATRVVAHSDLMQQLLKRVARFAASDAPVAVLGETGTGKEVIARLLHRNSDRGEQPFVAVNVAALPADLLESELFGHGRGAFTGAAAARRGLFEEAHGGTLFLDEIGEMPLPLQAKLLRVLQDGEVRRVGENRPFAVDARIVCATHCDLADLVRRRLFREDLYYRLKVLTLHVPPLRERKADIPPLAAKILREHAPFIRGFSASAMARMQAYAWPGNVRELQNVVHCGAALAEGHEITEVDLPAEGFVSPPPTVDALALQPLAKVERRHILRVLDACGGSQMEAARILGIGRNTLWRKLRAYAQVT